jgi:asparagine synthase (glutamine-hydrolysing)
MCGIVGIFDTLGKREIERALLSRMNQSLIHRGPDDSGLHIEPGVGLAHRRLSIIDLSSGHQPLTNEDGSVIVVYNGEIYNFQQLTRELINAGHEFRTRCDTEVIVHAWEEWGVDCVRRFRGMFAFGLWDRNQRTLFLARDRLGIKPLYYAELLDGQFIFSSEFKTLLLHSGLPRNLSPPAVEEYFTFGYVPEPRTILAHARKLPPGYTLIVKQGSRVPKPTQYWDIPFKSIAVDNEKQVQIELIDRLREAVRIRLISEVPLGAFLSGGVDSSAVVAMMADLSGEAPVNTCSISFPNTNYNESQFAEIVAERYRTRHHVDQLEPDDFDLLDKLAGLYEEPYADSSAIPTYRVCELAKKRVTVALSGDGGDEIFAGYRRYRWHLNEERIRRPVPQGVRGPLFGLLGMIYPKLDWAPRIFRAKAMFQTLARDSLEAYLQSVSVMHDGLRTKLFAPNFRRKLQGYNAIEVFRNHAARAPSDHPLSLIQYLDLKTYLPGDILTKVDRASMAHALEVRVPILDHEFVEWISGLPPELKLSRGEGKYIFKRALGPYLSDEVLYRRKMGFAVPLSNWFRGPLRERVRNTMLEGSLLQAGIFNERFIRQIVEQHQKGLSDHSAPIWSLLMFEAFQRRTMASA